MRWAVWALAALLAAGCTAPTESDPNPLLGLCPEWVQGPGEDPRTLEVGPDAREQSVDLAPPGNATEHRGRPLDLYRIRIDKLEVAGGKLQLRAFAEGRQLNWRDYRAALPQSVPVLTLENATLAEHEFDVHLSAIGQRDPAVPGPLTLQARFEGEGTARIEYTVTFHYRVCGAEL